MIWQQFYTADIY